MPLGLMVVVLPSGDARDQDAAGVVAFDPATKGAGIAAKDLLILAIWGIDGLLIALWRFSWSPRAASSRWSRG